MTRFTACLIAFALAAGVCDVAASRQEKGLYVVILEAGKLRGAFQPEQRPVPEVSAMPARTSVAVMRKDVRLSDGQIVTAFAFDGWMEGDVVRVVVSALVPPDGANRYVEVTRGMPPSFRKREFARLTVAAGETRSIDEMKAIGLEPMSVRVDTKSPF